MTRRYLPASLLALIIISSPLGFIACKKSGPSREEQPAVPLMHASAEEETAARFDLSRIKHVIVIYQENWSFDGLYARFPKANGYRFGAPVKQYDAEGKMIDSMEIPVDSTGHPFTSKQWRERMPVGFYSLREFDAPPNPYTDRSKTSDVTHRFYHHQRQINGGANDQFLIWSDIHPSKPSGRDNMNPLVLSGVDASDFPTGKLAREYVMCDNCFQSAYGGSFLNHQWLVAARMPLFPNARASAAKYISKPESAIPAEWDNKLSAEPAQGSKGDYYAINTVQPPFPPSGKGLVLPPQTHATIGDRLDAKGVSWKWYAQGWDDVPKTMNSEETPFQFHHQPFNYFEKFNPKTPEGEANRRKHLVDLENFYTDLADDDLPAVSFIKLTNDYDEHPYDAAVLEGDQMVADIIAKVMKSGAWGDCAVIVTYDEFGGRWDHVKPPKSRDGFGPGSRIPMIVISPFARRGYVDHTQYETVSILATIERIWGLEALTERDRRAKDLRGAFVGK